jgi:hypothetical protein
VKSGAVLTCVAAISLVGCSTITTGTTQSILVDTKPSGAICRFSRSDREVGVVNPTPGMLMITKDKAPLTVICTKSDFYPNTGILLANFEPMTLGNILLGGIVGSLVDVATGANQKYDATLTVTLKKVEASNIDSVIDDIKTHSPKTTP